MKILHVCPLYYPSLGGNQIHIQTISEKLAALGEEVHVFTAKVTERYQFEAPDPGAASLKTYEVINGVHVHRFPINYFLFSLLGKKLIKVRGGYRFIQTFFGDAIEYWKIGPCVSGMLAAISRLKPDILLAVMENSFTTYLCYQAKQRFNIPFVFMPIVHTTDQRSFSKFINRIYAAADMLIACTDFEKNVLVKRGAAAVKIKMLPLGMPSSLLEGEGVENVRQAYKIQKSPTVSFIGRLAYYKGIEPLFEAMKIVWEKYPSAQFLLAGKEEKLFASTLAGCFAGLTDKQRAKVIYIKNFNERQKKDLHHASDVVVMASNIDCFGLVYLEAWSCSKPVIACYDTPQETIIDDGKNGLLVRYGDADSLAQAILKLLGDEPLRLRLGKAGLEKLLKEYDLDQYAMKLRSAYEELLKQRIARF